MKMIPILVCSHFICKLASIHSHSHSICNHYHLFFAAAAAIKPSLPTNFQFCISLALSIAQIPLRWLQFDVIGLLVFSVNDTKMDKKNQFKQHAQLTFTNGRYKWLKAIFFPPELMMRTSNSHICWFANYVTIENQFPMNASPADCHISNRWWIAPCVVDN